MADTQFINKALRGNTLLKRNDSFMVEGFFSGASLFKPKRDEFKGDVKWQFEANISETAAEPFKIIVDPSLPQAEQDRITNGARMFLTAAATQNKSDADLKTAYLKRNAVWVNRMSPEQAEATNDMLKKQGLESAAVEASIEEWAMPKVYKLDDQGNAHEYKGAYPSFSPRQKYRVEIFIRGNKDKNDDTATTPQISNVIFPANMVSSQPSAGGNSPASRLARYGMNVVESTETTKTEPVQQTPVEPVAPAMPAAPAPSAPTAPTYADINDSPF